MKLSLETVASFTGRGFIDVHDVVAESPVHDADDEPSSMSSGTLSSRPPPPARMQCASTSLAPAGSADDDEPPTTPILPRSEPAKDGSQSRPTRSKRRPRTQAAAPPEEHVPAAEEAGMSGGPLDSFGDMGFVKTV
ncbi:MAG: hypothetical protein FWD69_11455 [Polyangiaceae bacterium]|nr:hypothetical protein [Polyangiaceae bacterium]